MHAQTTEVRHYLGQFLLVEALWPSESSCYISYLVHTRNVNSHACMYAVFITSQFQTSLLMYSLGCVMLSFHKKKKI